MRRQSLILTTCLLLAGTAAPLLAQRSAPPAPAPQGKPRFGSFGVDLTARDEAIKPGANFWRYANNGWFKANPIPADRTSWGVSSVLSEEVEGQVRTILQEAGQRSAKDPVARQVSDLYASYMDEAGIEQRGAAVLQPYLTRIAAARTKDDLIRLFAIPGYPAPIGAGIIPNPADPSRYIAATGQGGLGMPNRNYYLNEGEQFDKYRTGYREFVTTIMRLSGFSEPEQRADRIIALERRIAEAHWTPEQSRDVTKLINPMTPAKLAEYAPGYNFPLFLRTLKLDGVPIIIVANDTAVKKQSELFAEVPLETWKDWTAFHFVRTKASFLPRAFEQASFNFYSKNLSGVETQRERWKRGLGVVNGTLGESVGQLYVQRHFPPTSKAKMEELVRNLRAAFNERLQQNQWMDEATKKEALAKLEAFDPRVGYPNKWLDYSSMRIDRADLLGNMLRANEFQYGLQLQKLAKPVDRSDWAMTPQTINAYYSPLSNQITFPAAILQPPFFDPNADPAVNYGAIGAVIGHEIGHGFDDQGSRFDAQGRFREWWTPAARERFTALTQKLGAQYGTYETAGQKVNPQLTMGENIGDLGGLEMAYAAYRKHVQQHGEPPLIDGLTGDQRFFLAFAQAWRSHARDDALRQQVLTDPHSPAEFRVNGVVRNVDAWYKAFNIQPGDPLYLPPEQRVRIW